MFIVLRNMTPSLRLWSMSLYGWLGCITLETCEARLRRLAGKSGAAAPWCTPLVGCRGLGACSIGMGHG